MQTVQIARTEVVGAPVLTVGNARYTHGEELLVRGLEKGTVSGTLQKYRAGKSVVAGAILLMPAEGSERVPHSAIKLAAGVLTVADDRIRHYWEQIAGSLLTAGPTRNVRR